MDREARHAAVNGGHKESDNLVTELKWTYLTQYTKSIPD